MNVLYITVRSDFGGGPRHIGESFEGNFRAIVWLEWLIRIFPLHIFINLLQNIFFAKLYSSSSFRLNSCQFLHL